MLSYKQVAAVVFAATFSFQLPVFAQEDALIAKVGGVEIRQSELDLAINNLDPQLSQLSDEQRKVAALSGAVDVKLLVQKAVTEGLDKSADFEARIDFLRERELHNVYFRNNIVDAITDADVKARYDKEVANLPEEEEVNARHILVATEDEAKAVIAELDGGKDFAEVAKEKSTDSNKDDGGDLGWFGKGRMVPEFETAAFGLEKGAYTKAPVQSQFGFHVIKLEDKRIAPPPAYEAVEPQVRQMVMRDKYIDLIEQAKAEQKVEIYDEALKTGYEEASKELQEQE